MNDFGLYVILTRPALGHAAVAGICVGEGVKMLQLREKGMSDRALLSLARTLRDITKGTETRLVINDRPDIAALCGADFVHIGRDDLPIEDVRRLVGKMGVGVSTHSLVQAYETLPLRPDYIGFGPVFATDAKAVPDPPVGMEPLREVLSISPVPVVAIGGVFPENMADVVAAGARNVAMVRHLMQVKDTGELRRRIRETKRLLCM